jgi:hypothetical protein
MCAKRESMNQRVWFLGLLFCGALTGSACGSDSAEEPNGAGGGAPELVAGAGGQGGPNPDQCTELADPPSSEDRLTLEELEELEASCDVDELTVYRSSCGGTYVEVRQGVTESTWVFDSAGELIGGSYEAEGTCEYWGSTCGPVGKGESLCEADGACAEHASCAEWGANFYCPETLDDLAAVCGRGGVKVERYASSCAGTVVEASDGVQSSTWTFNGTGKLIGVRSRGDVGDCDYWGTECRPLGSAQTVCSDGGAGGAGEGGAGEGSAGEGDGSGGER